jgi:hypothetical protein
VSLKIIQLNWLVKSTIKAQRKLNERERERESERERVGGEQDGFGFVLVTNEERKNAERAQSISDTPFRRSHALSLNADLVERVQRSKRNGERLVKPPTIKVEQTRSKMAATNVLVDSFAECAMFLSKIDTNEEGVEDAIDGAVEP